MSNDNPSTQTADPKLYEAVKRAADMCHAGKDGECHWSRCPQIRDGYCDANGNPILLLGREHRFCPLPGWGDDE